MDSNVSCRRLLVIFVNGYSPWKLLFDSTSLHWTFTWTVSILTHTHTWRTRLLYCQQIMYGWEHGQHKQRMTVKAMQNTTYHCKFTAFLYKYSGTYARHDDNFFECKHLGTAKCGLIQPSLILAPTNLASQTIICDWKLRQLWQFYICIIWQGTLQQGRDVKGNSCWQKSRTIQVGK